MQLVNGPQFLNTTRILLLPPPACNAATVTILLTSIYASLQPHKFDFRTEVLI